MHQAREHAKRPHPTKAGPGRYHKDGEKHGAAPVRTPGRFAGQHTNPERAATRRRVKAFGGRRQYLKQVKTLRRLKLALAA